MNGENSVAGSLTKEGDPVDFEGMNFGASKGVTVDGAAPTIDSVKVDPDSAEYASGDVLTLSATSKAGSNITSLVTFAVTDEAGSPATGFTLDAENATLTVNETEPAPAGTYTVKASAKEGESRGEATATFTIIPKKITDPKVAITGFAKGNDIIWDLKIEPKDTAGLTSDGVTCYEGPGVTDRPVTGKFKADMTYTLAITLDAMENYELGEGTLTYTINGGEEMTTPIVEKNDFQTPYYQAVVTARTAGLDSPTLVLNELNATYGDLLFSVR